MINLYLLLELLGFGVAFALGSIGLAWVGRRCMARIAGQAPGAVQDQRVAEVMKDAKSGVATVVGFVLALALSAARDQYSLASDIAVREAFEVLRLQRLLASDAHPGVKGLGDRLRAYVDSSVSHEWVTLSERPARLSRRTDAALESLRAEVARLSSELRNELRDTLRDSLIELEHLRQRRLEVARRTSYEFFWLVVGIAMLLAALLGGHGELTRGSMVAAAGYWFAIGLLVCLTVEFQQPYRGLVRVDPAILLESTS